MPASRLLIAALAVGACRGASTPPAVLRGEIVALLETSAAAWNRGDLDAFMHTYLSDSSTTFVTSDGAHYGFDWIRARYAPRFAAGAVRDSLRFDRVAARPLGADYALVTAHYVLFRGDSVTATGPFTLVLVRTAGGWRMIHDHTS